MPKHICATCPFFVRMETQPPSESSGGLQPWEGYCQKNPPVVSPIGASVFPRVKDTLAACGAHPDLMRDAYLTPSFTDAVLSVYLNLAPKLADVAMDMADRMEERESKKTE